MPCGLPIQAISIHALREEGDKFQPFGWSKFYNFYPRPPRGGRRGYRHMSFGFLLFLSTPSARRATHRTASSTTPRPAFLSTPSARRATRKSVFKFCLWNAFLSTPSARRATPRLAFSATAGVISIHALREEGDKARKAQSKIPKAISIHALREEGDHSHVLTDTVISDFYPRPPRGGRLTLSGSSSRSCNISIHALREEGDAGRHGSCAAAAISIHALREEGDGLRCRLPPRHA